MIYDVGQEVLGFEDEDDGLEGIGPDELLDLLEEANAEPEGDEDDGPAANKDSENRFDNVVFKAPMDGKISRKGADVYCGDMRCGSISYLIHWNPAAYSANCRIHANCYVTMPLVGPDSDEDLLVGWLGSAPSFRTGEDHGLCAPKGSYHRRKPYKATSQKWC